MYERLVVAQINFSSLTHNFSSVKKLLNPGTQIMSILKANAYGHGAIEIAKHLASLGTEQIGVVCLFEARQLREAGITVPILIMNYSDPDTFSKAVDLDISLNIMDERSLKILNQIARKQNKIAKIHVKVDTGMHRLGLNPQEALKFLPKIENYSNIFLEGIFSHFATADEADIQFANEQLNTFTVLINRLQKMKINPPQIHIANSAATLRLPNSHFSLVRPGIILYGIPPSLDFKMPFAPKPILTLKTQIIQLRIVHKGESVGYGRSFTAQNDTLVAALPVGYGDGFRRGPNNWGNVLVKGQHAQILGRVSMDQSSIDVTHIKNIKIGDEVILIGKQGKEEITTWDIAQKLGTIAYEVTTNLSSRVTRIYED